MMAVMAPFQIVFHNMARHCNLPSDEQIGIPEVCYLQWQALSMSLGCGIMDAWYLEKIVPAGADVCKTIMSHSITGIFRSALRFSIRRSPCLLVLQFQRLFEEAP